jgi:hypothetical protein
VPAAFGVSVRNGTLEAVALLLENSTFAVVAAD